MDMTIKECYEQLGQNYEEVLDRLGSEVILKKFVIKFLDDPSFQMLEDGLKEKNADQAFRAAHTIKGICLNLGFDKLYQASSDLTE
jgi:HPt (histidine-containing phosphotransfer) domain-containing protein